MTWLRRLVRRGRLEAELERELRFHRDASGEPEFDAAAEACRDARGTLWAEDLGRDLRLSLREWRRRPGFAAVVLATLGLGIAATAIMAALVEGVILRPLAFAHPRQLVSVQERTGGPVSATARAEGWGNLWAVTVPNYRDFAAGVPALDTGAWAYAGGLLESPGRPDYVDGDRVSANLLPMLGVHPAAGRWFLPAEDRPGGDPVAVLGFAEARDRFGGAALALGGHVQFDGSVYTVVGVMPSGFDLNGYTTADAPQILLPLGQDTPALLANRGRHFLGVAGRLRPGATLAQARQQSAAVARRLQARFSATNANRDFLLRPWRADLGADATTLALLAAAAGLVLLLVCVNVSGLLLSRSLSRRRDLALRAALGASRGRLVRQCLTESAGFGLGGGLLGLAWAAVGLRPFVAWWPGGLPRAAEVALDARVLCAAAAVALGCGLAAGLAPALRQRAHPAALQAGSRSLVGAAHRWQRGLVAAQVGLAVVLLAAAGVLGSAMLRLRALSLGVNPRAAFVGRVALPPPALANPAATRAAWRALLDRVRRVPGVEAAATVDTVPLRAGNNTVEYWSGAQPAAGAQLPTALATAVSSGYFTALGIPVREGRAIADRDRLGATPVAVVDTVLARHLFGGRDPIGRPINIGLGNDPLTIVGVVGHVRYWGPAGDDTSPVRDQVYYSFDQVPDRLQRRWSELTSIAVRGRLPPASLLGPVGAAVRAAGAAFYDTRTMDELARGQLDQQRFLLRLFALFAALALLLAGLGIYGVEAHLAAERMPELGVRVALGARRGSIIWMVARETLLVVAVGAALGGLCALGAVRALRAAVAGVGGIAPGALALLAGLLLAAAAAAALVPARRASRVDPVRCLRQD